LLQIGFYLTRGCRSPVEEFIRREAMPIQAAMVRALERIREQGLEESGVSLRQVRGKLWEMRFLSRAAVRIFYVTRGRAEVILLHAYRKRSPKAPRREIELALRRMKEVLE
jgi:phage-related protein